jgi:homoprotocatechuate degradation regulator HpaR
MLLYRALDDVLPRFRALFARFALTETQWRVLRVLWEHDGCGLTELAASTLIPAPSLVGVVDRLGRDGLLTRRRSAGDRRAVEIRLTPKGRRLEGRVRPLVDEIYRDLEAQLTAAQWRGLFTALDALHEAASGAGEEPLLEDAG